MNYELLSKVGSYDFLVEPFHCDFSHRIFIGHLGNHLLNAADFHSNERGYGMDYLNTVHKTWVLSRFVMEMQDMPVAYDRITVDTWVENVMKYFTSRNFAVRTSDGTVCGFGRSIWAMIDTGTRQPVDILAERDGLIKAYIETGKPCPIEPFKRIRVDKDAKPAAIIDTHYSDIDVNGHVNSVKYIEHMLDLWPLEWYRRHRLMRLNIAYTAETHFGDRLHFIVQECGDCEFNIQAMKQTPDNDILKEACRGKLTFKEL